MKKNEIHVPFSIQNLLHRCYIDNIHKIVPGLKVVEILNMTVKMKHSNRLIDRLNSKNLVKWNDIYFGLEDLQLQLSKIKYFMSYSYVVVATL